MLYYNLNKYIVSDLQTLRAVCIQMGSTQYSVINTHNKCKDVGNSTESI